MTPRRAFLPAIALFTILRHTPAAAQSPPRAAAFVVPQWAFPFVLPPTPPVFDSVVRHRVPGSTRRYTVAQAQYGFAVADWFPAEHPPMPRPVAVGHAPVWRACGYCHLPDGRGRPENATISGLPAEYIRAQIRAFADSSRRIANPLTSYTSMHQIAAAAPDSDVAAAAEYFSQLRALPRHRVIESARVPKTRIEGLLYVRDGPGTEPIAGRLIEFPDAFLDHELHDSHTTYLTHVPPGTLARGRRLATEGPVVCALCHGPKLLGGGIAPPIGGRSPSYLLRQLINFKTGARHDAGSGPMTAIVAPLTLDDMVALAAWVGSRTE